MRPLRLLIFDDAAIDAASVVQELRRTDGRSNTNAVIEREISEREHRDAPRQPNWLAARPSATCAA